MIHSFAFICICQQIEKTGLATARMAMCGGWNSRVTTGTVMCSGLNSSSGGELELYLDCTGSTHIQEYKFLIVSRCYSGWILKHSESQSVYASESDFGWSRKVLLDNPSISIFYSPIRTSPPTPFPSIQLIHSLILSLLPCILRLGYSFFYSFLVLSFTFILSTRAQFSSLFFPSFHYSSFPSFLLSFPQVP